MTQSDSVFQKKYLNRRELLVSGFSIEATHGIITPIVILKYIEKYHSKKPKFVVNAITNNYLPLFVETYFQHGLNNLFNIKQYKLILTDFNQATEQYIIEPEQISKKIFDDEYLYWTVFKLESIKHSFSPKNFLLRILRTGLIKIKFKIIALNDQDETVEQLNHQINLNLVRDDSLAPITMSGDLEFTDIEQGYNWKKFQTQIKKAMSKCDVKPKIHIIKRLFYFLLSFRYDQKQIIEPNQLLKFIKLKAIQNDHDFKEIQEKVLRQIKFK